jgi:hypothetical protein
VTVVSRVLGKQFSNIHASFWSWILALVSLMAASTALDTNLRWGMTGRFDAMFWALGRTAGLALLFWANSLLPLAASAAMPSPPIRRKSLRVVMILIVNKIKTRFKINKAVFKVSAKLSKYFFMIETKFLSFQMQAYIFYNSQSFAHFDSHNMLAIT